MYISVDVTIEFVEESDVVQLNSITIAIQAMATASPGSTEPGGADDGRIE